MNEDDAKLIAECQRYSTEALSPTNRDFYARITQRLRELLTPDDNKGSIPTVINAPPCDAARELMKLLAPFSTAKKEDEGVDLITSALTAHGEAVKERCAKVCEELQRDDCSARYAGVCIRKLNLTEAS